MLAKALYDNLADAPDELTFRKGDIVTVIERDVDGLVGWWLCLLHGRQGIVPGNRLKIIPPGELDQFEKESREKVFHETDIASDSLGAGNYDELPGTKNGQRVAVPLSIKDMFNIPYKNEKKNMASNDIYIAPKNYSSETDEIYDIPKNESLVSEETYDVPRNNDILVEETYDIPKSSNLVSEEIYDIPKGDSMTEENYDVPKKRVISEETYDVPKHENVIKKASQARYANSPFNKTPDFKYNITKSNLKPNHPKTENPKMNILDVESLMDEIYDSPFNSENQNTIKRSPKNSRNNTPRNSKHEQGGSQEDYDVPKPFPDQELYDVPKHNTISTDKQNFQLSKYDIPSDRSNLQESFHTPSSSTELISQEIYDVPKNREQSENFIAPRVSMEAIQDEMYDSPKSINHSSQGPFKTLLEEVYDVPVAKNKLNSRALPREYIPKSDTSITRQLDIYDVPSSNESVPLHDSLIAQRQKIDQEIRDTQTTDKSCNNQQDLTKLMNGTTNNKAQDTPNEIYDTPPSRTFNEQFLRNNQHKSYQEDIYQSPVQHRVADVMVDVQRKSVDRTKRSSNLSNRLANMQVEDDDYVDYHDIWNKEPPKALVNEHLQVTIAITFFFCYDVVVLESFKRTGLIFFFFCSFCSVDVPRAHPWHVFVSSVS